ncbi:MAG: bifunctional phosphopantothenoylcysteine decarboxylase/phosphopantothenate synthase, partial [Rhodospirillaceae bacterium]|nr:bifunctional phosphopantothenoylcysteine decarboxylase/phosphopantothenate synthase [Rhodospirillaceae bacterium]
MGNRVLLIVSGGIAAVKCPDLIRRLADRGIATRCVLTRGGAEFVTPLSLAALSGDKVYEDLFSLTDENDMGHIELSRDADLILVAPASADILAKMA